MQINQIMKLLGTPSKAASNSMLVIFFLQNVTAFGGCLIPNSLSFNPPEVVEVVSAGPCLS